MKVAAIALGIWAAWNGQVLAQSAGDLSWEDLSREATIAAVSDALAEINAPFVRANYTSSNADFLEGMIDGAITQVLVLRDGLASNPYVRLSSFTVGFPWGVSVEFTFPEADVATTVPQ